MNIKKIVRILLELICLGLIFLTLNISSWTNEGSNKIQEDIANEIIRFHVIANSDSIRDQSVKLKVKDAVVESLTKKMREVQTKEEARIVIKSELSNMENIANNILLEEGENYKATASLTRQDFPVKLYGDMSFPAGNYEAVRIQLGKSEGKNWWCVMFPSLCLIDGTYQVVPDESKEKLKYVLTEEEYQSLLINQNVKVEPKFQLIEWWKKLNQ